MHVFLNRAPTPPTRGTHDDTLLMIHFATLLLPFPSHPILLPFEWTEGNGRTNGERTRGDDDRTVRQTDDVRRGAAAAGAAAAAVAPLTYVQTEDRGQS